jgi:hypothetical protein
MKELDCSKQNFIKTTVGIIKAKREIAEIKHLTQSRK